MSIFKHGATFKRRVIYMLTTYMFITDGVNNKKRTISKSRPNAHDGVTT